MHLIQPPPCRTARTSVNSSFSIDTKYQLFNVQSRYSHHAGASGYDQLSRYLGKTLDIRRTWHILGETLLRPFCLAQAQFMKHREYSRYDCAFELDLMSRMLKTPRSVFHFLYAEKGYRLSRYVKKDHVFVGTVHHPVAHHGQLFGNMKHFKKLDIIFVLSRDLVGPWQSIVEHNEVHFIPHGVDCEFYSPQVESRENIILFVGYHERDFSTLTHVANRILPMYLNWTLLMISNNPACQAIAETHTNAQTIWNMSDNEYLASLRKSSIMLLPLRESTACNATLEALACGVPVVTSSNGMLSYVNKSCGFVSEVRDVATMTEAIERLIENPRALVTAQLSARKTALSYDWPRVAQRIVNHLDKVWHY